MFYFVFVASCLSIIVSSQTCNFDLKSNFTLEDVDQPGEMLREDTSITSAADCFNLCCQLTHLGCNSASFVLYHGSPLCLLAKCIPLDTCNWSSYAGATSATILLDSVVNITESNVTGSGDVISDVMVTEASSVANDTTTESITNSTYSGQEPTAQPTENIPLISENIPLITENISLITEEELQTTTKKDEHTTQSFSTQAFTSTISIKEDQRTTETKELQTTTWSWKAQKSSTTWTSVDDWDWVPDYDNDKKLADQKWDNDNELAGNKMTTTFFPPVREQPFEQPPVEEPFGEEGELADDLQSPFSHPKSHETQQYEVDDGHNEVDIYVDNRAPENEDPSQSRMRSPSYFDSIYVTLASVVIATLVVVIAVMIFRRIQRSQRLQAYEKSFKTQRLL